MKQKFNLNLGSGNFKKKGFTNVDMNPNTKPDIIWDLDKFPYPFKSNSVDYIEMNHVLEHLEEPFKVMKECKRILVYYGILIVRVPMGILGYNNTTHKHGFNIMFPKYFESDYIGTSASFDFKCESMRIRWFAQPYLKKGIMSKRLFYFSLTFGKIFDFFANLSPMFCARIWSLWIGGFEEIEFKFVKEGGRE